MTPSLRNRFPGAKPFAIEDRDVFCGRKHDVDRVYEVLFSKRMLTLYAESGFGKTSLVNAGLIPKLEIAEGDKKFSVIRIRFGLSSGNAKEKAEPGVLDKMFSEIKQYSREVSHAEVPFIDEPMESSLWYEMKRLERNNIKVVLIFDQFEEIFTYHNKQLDDFKQQVHSLFSGIPRNLDTVCSRELARLEKQAKNEDELKEIDRALEFLYAPLNTKLLFVIREDRFGYINVFADYFPDILKDSYKLLPLTRKAAEEAIKLPALAQGEFKTPVFTFTDAALVKMLDGLAEKNDTYDPFTIQLTCRFIEKTVVEQRNILNVSEAEIPEVGIIVKDFIDSAWKLIPRKDQALTKLLIEEKLIAHEIERRVSVHESDWIKPNIADILIAEGLLKRERRNGIDYIELSHDRLIKPLLEDYKTTLQEKKIKRKDTRIVIIGLVVIFGFIGLLSYTLHKDQGDKEIVADSLVLVKKELSDFKTDGYKDQKEKFDEALIARDTSAAINSLKKAIALTDTGASNKLDTALSNLLSSKYQLKPFRVDIFYIDKEYEMENNAGRPYQSDFSENLAGVLQKALEKEVNFIVQRRLIRPKRTEGNPYLVYVNEIRYEADEGAEANKIKQLSRSAFKKTTSFSLMKKTKTTSPNYISIFLRNSNE